MSEVDVEASGVQATQGLVDDSVQWDGRLHSYRPSPDWRDRVSSEIPFHEDAESDIDPVTYEVIRNRLWSCNIAHGETLTRISGSPVFQALDFNMCILTEDADVIMNAPFILYLDGGAPLMIKYIMETFGDSPGIHEGDMFLGNDPWIGACHQMDALVSCPVFFDGRLFAWVANAGHQYDLGGIVPGGWPQNAPDVYSDPTPIPPFKILEHGDMRKDLELMYRRQSRMPDLVGLDLRAQIAGCRFAAEELRKVCEQFGPGTVKAAMRRIIDDAQQSVSQKLSEVPDGTHSVLSYLDERMPGDRDNYRMQLNVTKQGGRLTIDNKGTDEQQEGPIGFVYAAHSGAVIAAMSVTVLWEHLYASAGAERQVDLQLEPGLISCVDYPAAVSGGVPNAAELVQSLLAVLNRMIATVDHMREDVTGQQPSFPILVLAGEDDRGRPIGQVSFDPVAVGHGAKPDRDGEDTGGPNWCPLMRFPNAEEIERFFPIVYLYRRESADGGGVGRHRGGTGMEFAFTPYRARHLEAVTNVAASGVSTQGATGLFGGFPSPTTQYKVVKGTNLEEKLAAQRMIGDVDELEADEVEYLRGKSSGTALAAGDVLEMRFTGGGGYGDPLEREPERVAADVISGYVSSEAARNVYAVEVDGVGVVDRPATERLRDEAYASRSNWPPASGSRGSDGESTWTPASGGVERRVHECLVAKDVDGQRVLACTKCDRPISDYAGDYRRGLLLGEGPVTQIPLVRDPSEFVDPEMVLRQYACPGCYRLMSVEVARADDPVFTEMRLHPPSA